MTDPQHDDDQAGVPWDTTELGRRGGASFDARYDPDARTVTLTTPDGSETFGVHAGESWRLQAERELIARGYGNRWTRWESTDDGGFTMSTARTDPPAPAGPVGTSTVWVPGDDATWVSRDLPQPATADGQPVTGRVRVYPTFTYPVHGLDGEQQITITDWRKQGVQWAAQEARRLVGEALGADRDEGGAPVWWLGRARKDTHRWLPWKGTPRDALPVDPAGQPGWEPDRRADASAPDPLVSDLQEPLRSGGRPGADLDGPEGGGTGPAVAEEEHTPQDQARRFAQRRAHYEQYSGDPEDPNPAFGDHAADCAMCRDFAAGGDGVGRRLRVTAGPGSGYTFLGGLPGMAQHPAAEEVLDVVHTQLAAYSIPADQSGVLDVHALIGSLGALMTGVGAGLSSLAETFGESPVHSSVTEMLAEFAGSFGAMADSAVEVHVQWTTNPHNEHDLRRARGDIPRASLFNVS